MTEEDFKNLRTGDIICHKAKQNVGYIVHNNYGGRVTAIRQVDATNPSEWDILHKTKD